MENAPNASRPAPTPADLAALLALCGAALLERKEPNASGSNIYTSKYTLMGKIPVIRYVCCGCGYVENWVESPMELVQLHQTFGDR